MINIKKVAYQIKFDGMYNTILNEIEEKLNKTNLTQEEIENILKENEYFISEYKELNRYGELSSVHAKKLEIKESDNQEVKDFKNKLNQNVQILKNLENFEVNSKNSAYSIWIGSVGVMIIFMAHNIIALFSEYYTTHSGLVYSSYGLILAFTYWSYYKAKNNHEKQFIKYKKIHKKTKEMIKDGFEKKYFSYDEFYQGI